MKQGGLLDEGISPITICHTRVSSNEMFAERLLFVAARLDDAAPLPPPTIRSLHKSTRSRRRRCCEKCRLDVAAIATETPAHTRRRSGNAGRKKKNASFIIFKELHDALITVKKRERKKKNSFPQRSLCKRTVKFKIRR